jgi:hemolysin III
VSSSGESYSIVPFLGLKHPVSGGLHLLGAAAAALAAAGMIISSVHRGTPWHVLSAAVFGGTLFLLYASSSTYHLLALSSRATQMVRRIDHSVIYLFIAGTYTPFFLVPLRGGSGWPLLAFMWLFAIVGVCLKLLWFGSSRWMRIGLYLLMGWMCVPLLPRMFGVLGGGGFAWLAGGGLAYSVGAVIYALKRPDPFPRIFGYHEIWHLAVLLGSACHFWMIRRYVLGL